MLGQSESQMHTPAHSCDFKEKREPDSRSYSRQACLMDTERGGEMQVGKQAEGACRAGQSPPPTWIQEASTPQPSQRSTEENSKMALLEILRQECSGESNLQAWAYTSPVYYNESPLNQTQPNLKPDNSKQLTILLKVQVYTVMFMLWSHLTF